MPDRTYRSVARKAVRFLACEIKSPPFSASARKAIGDMLRFVQDGKPLGLPHSRPLPIVGPGCHELRINDKTVTWRAIYRVDTDAILVCAVFAKKTRSLPPKIITACRRRLAAYDAKGG